MRSKRRQFLAPGAAAFFPAEADLLESVRVGFVGIVEEADNLTLQSLAGLG